MKRRLTREERELWQRLAETVRPRKLRRSAASDAAPPERQEERERAEAGGDSGKEAAAGAPKPAAPPAAPPPLAPLEPRTRRRLSRGLVEIDARIDLHGMTQERAHATLVSFLRQSRARGHRIVLVITGKGGSEMVGVLRRAVPLWLARPDIRDLVAGFEAAGRRHGGEGALYVRLRRRRAGQLA